jgi:hypothetical protein
MIPYSSQNARTCTGQTAGITAVSNRLQSTEIGLMNIENKRLDGTSSDGENMIKRQSSPIIETLVQVGPNAFLSVPKGFALQPRSESLSGSRDSQQQSTHSRSMSQQMYFFGK